MFEFPECSSFLVHHKERAIRSELPTKATLAEQQRFTVVPAHIIIQPQRGAETYSSPGVDHIGVNIAPFIVEAHATQQPAGFKAEVGAGLEEEPRDHLFDGASVIIAGGCIRGAPDPEGIGRGCVDPVGIHFVVPRRDDGVAHLEVF